MRDYAAEESTAAAGTEEPRGREALDLSPIGRKAGLAYDLARGPMKSRWIDLASKLTSIALTVAACGVVLAAVWAGLNG